MCGQYAGDDNDGGGEETLFPVGTRADRRNEIIYCVWRSVVDWPGSCMAREPVTPGPLRAGTDSPV